MSRNGVVVGHSPREMRIKFSVRLFGYRSRSEHNRNRRRKHAFQESKVITLSTDRGSVISRVLNVATLYRLFAKRYSTAISSSFANLHTCVSSWDAIFLLLEFSKCVHRPVRISRGTIARTWGG